MLQKLYIKNYTLIKELDIPFYNGLSTITGETGAGKSIILGALKLVLGDRADYSIFHKDSEKCVIEAQFKISDDFQLFFAENELDFEHETIIRREVSPDGKSRAFINDVPVRLQILQELSSRLIDIHSQFDNAKLFDEAYQFNFLDYYANLEKEVADYQARFNQYKSNQYQLKLLEEKLGKTLQNSDYNQFLLEELQSVDLENVDIENLEEELHELQNVQSIQESLAGFEQIANEENIGLNAQLQQMYVLLQKATEKSSKLRFILERFESLKIDFQDLENDIAHYADSLEYQPDKIDKLNAEYNQVQKLLQKHQVSSIGELIDIREKLDAEHQDSEGLEEQIKSLKATIDTEFKQLTTQAKNIHQKRNDAILKLSEYVIKLFKDVGLEKAEFNVDLKETNELNEFGKEQIQMMFSANKGIPMQPIQNGISGGERSRVMLVLKKVMAEHQHLATLILDEIDTGVSGKVANSVGNLMKSMAENMQLIVITHLAQIASKGNHHYTVYKKEVDGATRTYIEILDDNQRVVEVAKLISGENVTDASLTQAKELLHS